MRARTGISGWRYPPWRGTFYPPGLPQRLELQYAAERLATIEINGAFYSLQRPASYQTWRDATPPGFVFSVKGGRFITHMLRLKGVRTALANFFGSGVLALGDKLGPVLWQLPATLAFDEALLDEFLGMLPRTTAEAAALAGEHDHRIDGRVFTDIDADRPLRHALEVRHPGFDDQAYFALLRRHNVASVVADTAGKWPFLTEVTADFVYVRLHGDEELYVSGYGDEALDAWAARVQGWVSGDGCPDGAARDVYVYFDNDVKVRAPFDALALADRLSPAPAGGSRTST